MGDFNEGSHPRSADGKFGAGGGDEKAKAILAKVKDGNIIKAKSPEVKTAPLDEHHEARVTDAREFAGLQARLEVLAKHGVNASDYAVDRMRREQGREQPGGPRVSAEMHAKLEPLLAEASSHAAKHAEATVRGEIANEQRALDAGHIAAPPDAKLKAFHEAAEASAVKLDGASEALHVSASKASGEIAKLSAMRESLANAGIDVHQNAHGHLGIDDGHAAADQVALATHNMRSPHTEPTVRPEAEPQDHQGSELSNEHDFSYHDHPERDPDNSDSEHADHVADFQKFRADVDAYHTAYKHQADVAHDALEELHAAQTAALGALGPELKKYDKAHQAAVHEVDNIDHEDGGLVNSKAFAHHDRDEDGEITDGPARAQHEAAHEASHTLLESEVDRRDRMKTVDTHEVRSALRDGLAETASNLRAISKITGRTPARLAT